MTDPSHYLFWITSRAAGITAMVLASVAVGYGLMMAGRLGNGRAADRRPIHETLSLAVMVAIAVHGLSLLGDTYLRPSLLDITVPFTLSYKTIPTSIGILAAWATFALGLSYYLRGKIGVKRWRMLHRFTVLAWAAGILHALLAGTDAGQLWFTLLVLLCVGPVLGLLAARYGGLSRARSRIASPSGPPVVS
jgi:sulfoxide reductase heme-binding subunit YedZ